MLQRAASNAYSWWWASHIRTKQSKWLEQCLQDMEEKVQTMLTMIEGDGDSFAKRAEMYYKRRPELISSVEEAYKSFRAVADRYDMLSKDLQNANHTIATVFPEQVQFGFEDDEDFSMSKFPNDNIPLPLPNALLPNIPQVPKLPNKDFKRVISTAAKQLQPKKSLRARNLVKPEVTKSGLNRDEALEEINKLQKEILTLQTEKEFVKSSYESGVTKYWDIENRITAMQKRVSSLQDEFDIGSVIEDNEARTLMAEAALKSCQETLVLLQEKQEKTSQEAQEEYKRIKAAHQRLQSIKQRYLQEQMIEENPSKVKPEVKEKIEPVIAKSQGDLDLKAGPNMKVTEMAEKIDELVNKVIGLETVVSSQAVLVRDLRSETDDLNAQIRTLEEEKENHMNDMEKLRMRVKKAEEKLSRVQDLNKNVDNQSNDLQSNFAEARTSINSLSGRLSSFKLEEELEQDTSDGESELSESGKLEKDKEEENETKDGREMDGNKHVPASSREEVKKEIRKTGSRLLDRKPKAQQPPVEKDIPDEDDYDDKGLDNEETSEEQNWQQVLWKGEEDHEKSLYKAYKALLSNYKDLKKKLHELERNEKDNDFDTTLQMMELKKIITKKDDEVRHLRQKLKSLQGNEDSYEDVTDNLDKETDEEIKSICIDRLPSLSNVEGNIRTQIDVILDENLDFWLSFSTAIQEVQKFRTEVQDLQSEMSELKEKKRQSGSCGSISTEQVKSEIKATYKHLREVQRGLRLWSDQNVSMKDEVRSRFASLCSIQEDITRALKEGAEEEEIRFASHQAAKFQGEIMNMKQENDKVRNELQAALDIARMLQVEVEKMLRNLKEFGIGNENPDNMAQSKVPLRSFLFGTKLKKKHRASLFSCMNPTNKR